MLHEQYRNLYKLTNTGIRAQIEFTYELWGLLYTAAEPGTTPPPHTHPSLCVFPSDQMQLSAASFKHPYTLWQDVVCGATTGAAHT